LIDSVAELRTAATDDVGFSEYAYSLLQRTSRAGISLFGTYEIPELYGVTRISDLGISYLSDNVVLLQYVRSESTVKRALTVMKTRASGHDPSIREFTISSDGIRLGDPFDASQRWR
jgi:circadian clock protein KaiC